MTEGTSRRDQSRARIIDVAAGLLREHGPAAVTTRGVAQAAGVQAPAIYRLFGDKDGLLDAVAEHLMLSYATAKAASTAAARGTDTDPLADLRAGWEAQVDFGLTHPAIFRLLSDPDRVQHSAGARTGREVLASRVQRVATTGRLRVSERRAVDIIQAAGIGVIQTLLCTPPEQRDAGLADTLYAAVLQQILTDAPAPPAGAGVADGARVAATVAVRALTPRIDVLSDAERLLMTEWLDRIIDVLQQPRPQVRPEADRPPPTGG